jgi:L-fucose isomerase-like protein
VETIDLSEIFGRARQIGDADSKLKAKLEQITHYIPVKGVPDQALVKMAKLGLVIDDWMVENHLVASALQCWTAMEEFYGVQPCTLMSIMSNELMPSACETDIADKGVIFHCSNLPKDMFIGEDEIQAGVASPDEMATMSYQAIIADSVGKENTFGTVVGRLRAEPFTFCRVSTDDFNGRILAYVGEGELTNDPLRTFGGYGVARVPRFQRLLGYICEHGFEHHTAINLSQTASAMNEALSKYLDWDVYYHNGEGSA